MPRGILVVLNVFVEPKELDAVADSLVKLPEVLDLYEVTGEYDLVALINADTIKAFRELIKDKILNIRGVKSTVTYVVVHTHKKDGKPVSE